MGHEINLPFQVGQVAEARTFEEGFRGAWFRCKIRKIEKKKGRLGHVLEYIDFPEEKLDWTELYQVASHYEGNKKGKHRELMVRPPYPPIYNEKQKPRVSEIKEVTVIRDDSWRVGDSVDWWTNDCYWSGRITHILGDDEAQIDLTPPPLGEGSTYKALFKDLRPSLEWSPELGWTVPTQEDDTGHPRVHIIKPVNQVIDRIIPVSINSAASDAAKSRTATGTRTYSPGKKVSKKQKHKQERSTSPGPADNSTRETSRVMADSGHNEAEPAAAEEADFDDCQEKNRASGRVVLLSKRPDLIEAAILDLEEYVNKVRWLKKLLQYGVSLSDTQVPQWEFVE